MKNKSFFVLLFAAACLMAGCTELSQENFRKNKLKPELFFDFNTTSRVKVDLDYGEYGANTLISIFHGPFNFNEDGGIDNEPLFNIFSDDNGRAVSSFDLPGYISDSIFLLTSAIGTPQVVKATLADSTIRYKYESQQYSHDDFRTRVIDWPYFGYDNGYHISNESTVYIHKYIRKKLHLDEPGATFYSL